MNVHNTYQGEGELGEDRVKTLTITITITDLYYINLYIGVGDLK